MVNNELSLPDGSPRRISFAHASSLLVAQAITDANALLVRHFPTLAWATWGAALRELQPDVLVHGSAVTFDWQDLARRVQGLASESAPPALAPPATGPTAAELTAELQTYQRLAALALAQLPECPRACGLLARELLTKLAHGRALAERVNDAMPGASQQPATTLCPSVVEPPNAAEGASSSLGEGREAPSLVSPSSGIVRKNTRGPARRRKPSKRRTFRDIVEHHPRGNGKFGFTVRELCTTMRISAASLTEARKNPGHLSVNKVVALAEVMEENPLQVLADLMTEAASKQRRKRKKRVAQP